MNIPSEAKTIATSIIEWCYRKEDVNEDENYPSHLVENLLKRQKQELIDKAYKWLDRYMVNEVCAGNHSSMYADSFMEKFKKAMEEE